MNTHHLLLVIHLLAASVWVGGHIILLFGFWFKAKSTKDINLIDQFRKRYELVGMPALIIVLITGVWMSSIFGITPGGWFHFNTPLERVVSLKLVLLICTMALAFSVQIFWFRKGKTPSFQVLSVLIWSVTIIGVSMLLLGTLFRYGGLK